MDFTFDKTRDATPHNAALLHVVVDTTSYDNGVGGILVNIIRPIANWTFMVFLSEGARNRLVCATLNDGSKGAGKLWRYPVVVHELDK